MHASNSYTHIPDFQLEDVYKGLESTEYYNYINANMHYV